MIPSNSSSNSKPATESHLATNNSFAKHGFNWKDRLHSESRRKLEVLWKRKQSIQTPQRATHPQAKNLSKESFYSLNNHLDQFSKKNFYQWDSDQIDTLSRQQLQSLSAIEMNSLLTNPNILPVHFKSIAQLYLIKNDTLRLTHCCKILNENLSKEKTNTQWWEQATAFISGLFEELDYQQEDSTHQKNLASLVSRAKEFKGYFESTLFYRSVLTGIQKGLPLKSLISNSCWKPSVDELPPLLIDSSFQIADLKCLLYDNPTDKILSKSIDILAKIIENTIANLLKDLNLWETILQHLVSISPPNFPENHTQDFWESLGRIFPFKESNTPHSNYYCTSQLFSALSPLQLTAFLKGTQEHQLQYLLKIDCTPKNQENLLNVPLLFKDAFSQLIYTDSLPNNVPCANENKYIHGLEPRLKTLKATKNHKKINQFLFEHHWPLQLSQLLQEFSIETINRTSCLTGGWDGYPWGYGRNVPPPRLIQMGWQGQKELYQAKLSALNNNKTTYTEVIQGLHKLAEELNRANTAQPSASERKEYPKPAINLKETNQLNNKNILRKLQEFIDQTDQYLENLNQAGRNFLLPPSNYQKQWGKSFTNSQNSLHLKNLQKQLSLIENHLKLEDVTLLLEDQKLLSDVATTVQYYSTLTQTLLHETDLRIQLLCCDYKCRGISAIIAGAIVNSNDNHLKQYANILNQKYPLLMQELKSLEALKTIRFDQRELRKQIMGSLEANDTGKSENWGLNKRLGQRIQKLQPKYEEIEEDPAIVIATMLSTDFGILSNQKLRGLAIGLNNWSDCSILANLKDNPLTVEDLKKIHLNGHPEKSQKAFKKLIKERYGDAQSVKKLLKKNKDLSA